MTIELAEDGQKLSLNFHQAATPIAEQSKALARAATNPLTRDNLHLSKLIPEAVGPSAVIADPDNPTDATLLQFLQAARATNTRRAYQSDVEHFLGHRGQIPADDLMVARYLADYAGQLSISTLQRRLVAIRSVHVARDMTDPTKSELVRLTLRGIRRMHGRPQRRVTAISPADLRAIVASLNSSIRDIRDAAILLIGFAGAFRRSASRDSIVPSIDAFASVSAQAWASSATIAKTTYCPVSSVTTFRHPLSARTFDLKRATSTKQGCCRHGRWQRSRAKASHRTSAAFASTPALARPSCS